MKFLALLCLFFVAAKATNQCSDPKDILMFSDETLMDRNKRVSENGDYCLYLQGDANLILYENLNRRNLRDRFLTSNNCNGDIQRVYKTQCRCDRDGGVDYKAFINNNGALKVYSEENNKIVWKSNRKLTNDCPAYALVVMCNDDLAIWSLKKQGNNCVPDQQKWRYGGQEDGGICDSNHACP